VVQAYVPAVLAYYRHIDGGQRKMGRGRREKGPEEKGETGIVRKPRQSKEGL